MGTTLLLSGCLVPDAPFQGASAAPRVAASAGPVNAYVADPLTGGRLALPTTSEAPSSASTADAEVKAFSADPRHPLFELVRSDMAQLLRSGRAADLQSAYDQAVAARRAKYQAEEHASGPGGG